MENVGERGFWTWELLHSEDFPAGLPQELTVPTREPSHPQRQSSPNHKVQTGTEQADPFYYYYYFFSDTGGSN